MMNTNDKITRQDFILGAAAAVAGTAVSMRLGAVETGKQVTRVIPVSGEKLPVLGMGTWNTFDVGENEKSRNELAAVLEIFFENGGTLVDSSPMYGSAETVTGDLVKRIGKVKSIFAATKVWTDGRQAGIDQMKRSMKRMGVDVMDLMQIHNLRDWKTHLPVVRDWKTRGIIRYIGITTSHGRLHDEMERIMKTEPLDFVQFSYSLDDRRAEKRLLPLAADKGIATLINRPFQTGGMFAKVKGVSLPDWCVEIDCKSWAQFFLKFIISHPAVTCVIPATANARHMADNMDAGFGRMPDRAMRARMLKFFESL